MKNTDIETFYVRAKSSIEIASSYIAQPHFKKIVISCRLKPITIFSGDFKINQLERWWVDEFGNSLLLENNQMKIIKKDVNIKYNTQVSTDLFYGRSILGTLEISKGIALSGDCIIFYGEDEYLRCFNRNTGEKISPLEVDMDDLINILIRPYSIHKLPNDEIKTIMIKEFSKYE